MHTFLLLQRQILVFAALLEKLVELAKPALDAGVEFLAVIVRHPTRAVADILVVPEQRGTSGTVASTSDVVWGNPALADCVQVIVVHRCAVLWRSVGAPTRVRAVTLWGPDRSIFGPSHLGSTRTS